MQIKQLSTEQAIRKEIQATKKKIEEEEKDRLKRERERSSRSGLSFFFIFLSFVLILFFRTLGCVEKEIIKPKEKPHPR